MQSFKEFLIEDDVAKNFPAFTMYVNFEYKKSKLAETDIEVGDKISVDTYKEFFHEINIQSFRFSNTNNLELTISVDKSGILDTQTHFNLYMSDLLLRTSKMVETNLVRIPFMESVTVTVDGFPKVFVGTDKLQINCSRVKTLSNLDKIINPKKLKLEFAHNIKGNVLSLLRMSNLKEIAIFGVKWVDIIEKHLKSSDRDLLDCQEDLVQAGFKEFARL